MEAEKFMYWYEFLELVLIFGLIPFILGLLALLTVLHVKHTGFRRNDLFVVCGHFLLSYVISIVLWLLPPVFHVLRDDALIVFLPCVLGEIISSVITYILIFVHKRA